MAPPKLPVDVGAALNALRGENDVLRDANRLLREGNATLQAQLAEVVKLNHTLEARIVDLEARLRSNSSNSSKPPSSDGYSKPAPKSRRRRSGRKPGKQPGAPGQHLAQVADPDVVVIHSPGRCSRCGGELASAPVTDVVRRQVFDLPPTALVSTEHAAEQRRCHCGTETSAAFPAEATAPACYGPRLRAHVDYLVVRQHIPVARVTELLRDAFGAPVSTGTVVAMVREGAGRLEAVLAAIRDRLAGADVVHADESGLRVQARLNWVHSNSTDALTLYHLDQRRGTAAMDAMGVLEHLTGVLVHDGWAPYRKYTKVSHALCNAHHIRELEAATEAGGQPWASDMITLLSDTWQLVLTTKAAGHSTLSAEELGHLRAAYRRIILAGQAVNLPAPPTGRKGRPRRTKAANLLSRLDIYEDDVLRFAHDFRVKFDNNLAERDIRMVKVQQKVSGGFRSREGAEAWLAIRSYLSTAAKNGVNLFDALQRLCVGDPWMPAAISAGP
ncbi:MAG: IS66 family transposase [Candidatus Dormibacteria bacterium]